MCCDENSSRSRDHNNVVACRCKRKLHQRHLVSVRTLSSRQQAAHVLQVLSAAKEALGNFSTAFTLALLLSRDQQSSRDGSRQQQLGRQRQQQQQTLLVEEEEVEWQQLRLGREVADEGAQAQHGSHAPDSSTGLVAAAAAPEVKCQAPHQCPPCEPARSLSESLQMSQAGTATSSISGAVAAANTVHAAQLLASTAELPAAGPTGQQQDFSSAETALLSPMAWEHSQEGWQQLMQRAWRGNVQAVLACAQELIHGGDFVLQDFGLARKLLQTVRMGLSPGWKLLAVLLSDAL
jgi:hypothetical protein